MHIIEKCKNKLLFHIFMPLKKQFLRKRKGLTINTLALEIQEDFPEIANDFEDLPIGKLIFYYDIRNKYEADHLNEASLRKATSIALTGNEYISGLITNEEKIDAIRKKQKKKRTGLKAIIAAGAICALAYASDKADLSDQVGKAYREVRDYVTDVFTVNAGEASNEYISQLNEEAVPGNYSNQIGKATILAMGYLPNNSKVDVINQAISTMPMEYQKGVIINSLDEMSDSMKAELFKNEIKDMAPTYRNDVLQEAVKLSIDDKGNEIKSVYEKMKDFIQDKANDLKKVF